MATKITKKDVEKYTLDPKKTAKITEENQKSAAEMKRRMRDIKQEAQARRRYLLTSWEMAKKQNLTQQEFGAKHGLKVWRVNKLLTQAKKERDKTFEIGPCSGGYLTNDIK